MLLKMIPCLGLSYKMCHNKNKLVSKITYELYKDTFTTFELQTWLPAFILGINSFRIFCAWAVWAEVTNHFGNYTVTSLLLLESLKHLNNCLTLIGNTHKATEDWDLVPSIHKQLFHDNEDVFTLLAIISCLVVKFPCKSCNICHIILA